LIFARIDFLIVPVAGISRMMETSHHLAGGIAENLFRSFIPTGDACCSDLY